MCAGVRGSPSSTQIQSLNVVIASNLTLVVTSLWIVNYLVNLERKLEGTENGLTFPGLCSSMDDSAFSRRYFYFQRQTFVLVVYTELLII